MDSQVHLPTDEGRTLMFQLLSWGGGRSFPIQAFWGNFSYSAITVPQVCSRELRLLIDEWYFQPTGRHWHWDECDIFKNVKKLEAMNWKGRLLQVKGGSQPGKEGVGTLKPRTGTDMLPLAWVISECRWRVSLRAVPEAVLSFIVNGYERKGFGGQHYEFKLWPCPCPLGHFKSLIWFICWVCLHFLTRIWQSPPDRYRAG